MTRFVLAAVAALFLSFSATAQGPILGAPVAHPDGRITVPIYTPSGDLGGMFLVGQPSVPPNLEAEWQSNSGSGGTTTWRVVTKCTNYVSMEACWKAHNQAVAIGQRINKPL